MREQGLINNEDIILLRGKRYKVVLIIFIILLGLVNNAEEIVFPNYGGEINISLSSLPEELDPIWHIRPEVIEIDELIYDSLCEINDEGKVVNLLLNKAEMVGNIWYFDLKEDIMFYPFLSFLSSYDVKNSLLYCKESRNPYSYLLNKIESIEAIDTYKFLIKLNEVEPNFLELLCHPSFSIVRRWKNEVNDNAIAGIGSFKNKVHSLPDFIGLTSNEYYYEGKPFIDGINILSSDKVNPVFYYRAGMVQVLSLWGHKTFNIGKTIQLENVVKAKNPLIVFLLLNPTKGETGNKNFRKWLVDKLDKNDLLKGLFDNKGKVVSYIFSNGRLAEKEVKGYNSKIDFQKRNEKISILILRKDIILSKIAERIQAILISEGFEVEIETQDVKNYIENQDKGNYNILLGSIISFYRSNELNIRLLASIYSHIRKEGEELLQESPYEFENHLLSNNILVPLLSLEREYAISDKIEFYFSDFNSLGDLKNAWLR